jgi:hypothetical protein
MEHINISDYKLDKKGVNQLAFLLYKNPTNSELVNQIVLTFSLENLIKTKNNGIISNLLLYFISINDTSNIEQIITLGAINKFSMMKRDYLNLAKYFYQIDINISVKYFSSIFSLVTNSTDAIIVSKDVDFVIENKLFILLGLISGLFVESSINSYPLVDGDKKKLTLNTIDSKIIDTIKNYVEDIIGTEDVRKLNRFSCCQLTDFDAIIDGGNIIHARSGLINPSSLNDLKEVIEQVKEKIGNPLLVIHQRHLKKWPNLVSQLKISCYLTPYNMNDDNFIMWFFLNYGSKPYIISNDKYRDHIFKLETSNKNMISEYSFSQFNNILHQQILEYNISQYTINSKLEYSRCIQQHDKTIYVPHSSGKFIEINI